MPHAQTHRPRMDSSGAHTSPSTLSPQDAPKEASYSKVAIFLLLEQTGTSPTRGREVC